MSAIARNDALPLTAAPSATRAPTASSAQMVGVLGIFTARGTQVFNEVIGKAAQVGGGSLASMLPLKCLLSMHRDIYGPFLLNMALPFISAFVIVVILIPATLLKRMDDRAVETELATRQARREAAARGDAGAVAFVPPLHEPIVYLH